MGGRRVGLAPAEALAYILGMRCIAVIFGVLVLAGCSQPRILEGDAQEVDESLFAATSMRIHPIFTQVKDWTGDGRDDGIEVLVEFRDQFGDPVKAAGTVMFELYDYRIANPEPRGNRLANPWIGSILTLRDQNARWRRTSRAYLFQLEYEAISRGGSYVLAADFRATSGKRYFDRVVLTAQEEDVAPVTPPATPGQP